MKRVALPFVLAAFASCGDPMLPSGFSGPPAAAVKGNVLTSTTGASKDAEHPRLSLEWLDSLKTSLVAQSVSYERSKKLQTDWDIGLALPNETAKFDVPVSGGRTVRMGVGKLVYFDDRDNDGKLDWTCAGPLCDRVMAVSSEFVLYVDRPPYCQTGSKPKALLASGYHYYSLDSGALRETSPSDPLNFNIIDESPADAAPTRELAAFVKYLVYLWGLNPDGC
jgi:hypothetical protein